MPPLKDLTGKRFGRLTVLERHGSDVHGAPTWKCKCDCGNISIVGRCGLISGGTKSCGCLAKELSSARMAKIATTHGESRSRLYFVWRAMLDRCENPNRPQYKNYGGRGIRVCFEWHEYSKFSEWAKASGYDELANYGDCTLDRVDDAGDYCSSNCRWSNMTVQQRNKRTNVFVDLDGSQVQLSAACEIQGLNYPAVIQRIKSGWSEYDALHTPIKERKPYERRKSCSS